MNYPTPPNQQPQHGGYPAPPPPPAGWQPQPEPGKKRRWPWIVGGAAALIVAVGVIGGGQQPPQSTAGVSTTLAPIPGPPAEPVAATSGSTVVYEVLGKGTASVTYMKEGFSQEQITSAKLPFRKTLQFKDEVGGFSPLSIVAQNGGKGGEITCRITVDGEVVGDSTSSGQYAVVTCNGNG